MGERTPLRQGVVVKVTPSNLGELADLMDVAAYEKYVAGAKKGGH